MLTYCLQKGTLTVGQNSFPSPNMCPLNLSSKLTRLIKLSINSTGWLHNKKKSEDESKNPVKYAEVRKERYTTPCEVHSHIQ